MNLNAFNNQVEDIQTRSTQDAGSQEVTTTPQNLRDEIDRFQEQLGELDLSQEDLDETQIDEEFLATLQDVALPLQEYEQQVNEAIENAIREFMAITVRKNTESPERFVENLSLLNTAIFNDVLFIEYQSYYLEAIGPYVESVADFILANPSGSSSIEKIIRVSQQMAQLKVVLPNLELFDRCVDSREAILQSFIGALEAEVLGPDYLMGINENPFDYVDAIQALILVQQTINSSIQLEQFSRLDLIIQNATSTFVAAEIRLGHEQAEAANMYFTDIILPQIEALKNDVSLNVTDKIQRLESLLVAVSDEANRFQIETRAGQLSVAGLEAYARMRDFTAVQVIDSLMITLDEENQARVDTIIGSSQQLEQYYIQSAIAESAGMSSLFEFSLEQGMVATENFTNLPQQQQEQFLTAIMSIQMADNLSELAGNQAIPPELGEYFDVSRMVMNGEYEIALPIIERLLVSTTFSVVISGLPPEVVTLISERYGISLQNPNGQLESLKQACLLNEINVLRGILGTNLSNEMNLFGAASNRALTTMGMEFEEGADVVQIRYMNQFLDNLENGIRNGRTWQESYDSAVDSTFDGWGRQGYENGIAAEGFTLWQLVRDFRSIRDLPSTERRSRILQLANQIGSTSGNEDGIGRFGLAQNLLANEFAPDIERDEYRLRQVVTDRLNIMIEGQSDVMRVTLREQWTASNATEHAEWHAATAEQQELMLDNAVGYMKDQIFENSYNGAYLEFIGRIDMERGVDAVLPTGETLRNPGFITQGSRFYAEMLNRDAWQDTIRGMVLTAITTAATCVIAMPASAFITGAALRGLGAVRGVQILANGSRMARIGHAAINISVDSVISSTIFNLASIPVNAGLTGSSTEIDPRTLLTGIVSDAFMFGFLNRAGGIGRAVMRNAPEGTTFMARAGRAATTVAANGAVFSAEMSGMLASQYAESLLLGQEFDMPTSLAQVTTMFAMSRLMRGATTVATDGGRAVSAFMSSAPEILPSIDTVESIEEGDAAARITPEMRATMERFGGGRVFGNLNVQRGYLAMQLALNAGNTSGVNPGQTSDVDLQSQIGSRELFPDMPLEEMQLILFNRSVDSSTDIDTTLAQLRASNEIMAMAAPFAVVARTQNGFFAFDANNELRFFSERHNAESVPVDIFRSRYLDSEQVSQIMRKYEELVATARYNNAAMTLEYVAFLRQARENNPDLSMRDALAMFELNSVAIVDKYRGGNCFAMANHFVSTIRERLGIDAYVIGNDVYNEALTLNRSDWREAFDYIERAHGSVVIPYVNRDTLIPTYLHLEMGLPYEQARSHNYDEFSPNGYVKPEESLTNVDESIMTNQIRIRNKLVITDVSQKEVLVVNMLRGRLEINGKQTAMFMDKFTLPEMTYGRHGITIDLNSLLANLNQTRDIVFDGETVTLTNAEVINLVLEELGEHFDLPSDFAENMQYLLHRRDEYYSDLMLDSAGQVYRNQ